MAELVTVVTEIAFEGLKAALNRATSARENKEDVRAMLGYLEAGRLAIWGLGQEREEILSDAAVCDLEDKDCVHKLRDRLDKYLHTNKLRPELARVITGLSECREIVEQRTHKILNRLSPRVGDQKAELDKLYSLLVELSMFLQRLGDDQNFLTPSGIGVMELLHLEVALAEQNLDRAKLRVAAVISEARSDIFTNRQWLDITKKMEQVRVRLASAFE